jgi:hypothetical protein
LIRRALTSEVPWTINLPDWESIAPAVGAQTVLVRPLLILDIELPLLHSSFHVRPGIAIRFDGRLRKRRSAATKDFSRRRPASWLCQLQNRGSAHSGVKVQVEQRRHRPSRNESGWSRAPTARRYRRTPAARVGQDRVGRVVPRRDLCLSHVPHGAACFLACTESSGGNPMTPEPWNQSRIPLRFGATQRNELQASWEPETSPNLQAGRLNSCRDRPFG